MSRTSGEEYLIVAGGFCAMIYLAIDAKLENHSDDVLKNDRAHDSYDVQINPNAEDMADSPDTVLRLTAEDIADLVKLRNLSDDAQSVTVLDAIKKRGWYQETGNDILCDDGMIMCQAEYAKELVYNP